MSEHDEAHRIDPKLQEMMVALATGHGAVIVSRVEIGKAPDGEATFRCPTYGVIACASRDHKAHHVALVGLLEELISLVGNAYGCGSVDAANQISLVLMPIAVERVVAAEGNPNHASTFLGFDRHPSHEGPGS